MMVIDYTEIFNFFKTMQTSKSNKSKAAILPSLLPFSLVLFASDSYREAYNRFYQMLHDSYNYRLHKQAFLLDLQHAMMRLK